MMKLNLGETIKQALAEDMLELVTSYSAESIKLRGEFPDAARQYELGADWVAEKRKELKSGNS